LAEDVQDIQNLVIAKINRDSNEIPIGNIALKNDNNLPEIFLFPADNKE